ncbi:MAG: hypothetical protein QG610_1338 [Euryarchaeota archaeon]|nr:hypothetical protein [Euryarchaeota archaeon]
MLLSLYPDTESPVRNILMIRHPTQSHPINPQINSYLAISYYAVMKCSAETNKKQIIETILYYRPASDGSGYF